MIQYHWGICLKDNDEVVGTCGFYRGYPGNVAEVGYVLRAAYRGKGIMTEALRSVLDYGRTQVKLNGIVAYTGKTNLSSITVSNRLSFQEVLSEDECLKFGLFWTDEV